MQINSVSLQIVWLQSTYLQSHVPLQTDKLLYEIFLPFLRQGAVHAELKFNNFRAVCQKVKLIQKH